MAAVGIQGPPGFQPPAPRAQIAGPPVARSIPDAAPDLRQPTDSYVPSSQSTQVGSSPQDIYTPSSIGVQPAKPKKKRTTYVIAHGAHVIHSTVDAGEAAAVVANGGLSELAHHNHVGGHGHGHSHSPTSTTNAAAAPETPTAAPKRAPSPVPKSTPKISPELAARLDKIEASNMSADSKQMLSDIARRTASNEAGLADDLGRATKIPDNAGSVAGSADDAARLTSTVDDVAAGASKVSVLGRVAKGLGAAGAVVGTVAGPIQIADGITEMRTEDKVNGALNTASGVALTTSGVSGLAALAPAAAGTIAAPLTVGAGGAAIALDGVRQVRKSWDDRGQDKKVGAGLLKTAGGTAMMAGAAMMATGAGAPVGAALVVGGAVVSAGTYLAENTKVGQAVTKAVGGAAHAVADGVGEAVTQTKQFASEMADNIGDRASDLWDGATSWF